MVDLVMVIPMIFTFPALFLLYKVCFSVNFVSSPELLIWIKILLDERGLLLQNSSNILRVFIHFVEIFIS